MNWAHRSRMMIIEVMAQWHVRHRVQLGWSRELIIRRKRGKAGGLELRVLWVCG